MASEKVLVTGGAGFIGRRVVDVLLSRGADVVVLDALIEQVHPTGSSHFQYRNDVELLHGDVRDEDMVKRALKGTDAVIHLAAEVGVGQSMYAVARYTSTNDCGTAVLLQSLQRKDIRRVVVASSMSIYGEGLYRTSDGRLLDQVERQTRSGWDPVDDVGAPLEPVATPEWKRPALASVYALNKYAQERMTLLVTQAYGIEGCALRLFNVFGPGQALSNPYTGVLAIFASRLLNGERPLVFEDGRQRRDFVHVDDVAHAFVTALEHPAVNGGVFNIGSGHSYSVIDVAKLLADAMGRPELHPKLAHKARIGDIRHCFADITRAANAFDYRPTRLLEESLSELTEWVKSQNAIDHFDRAHRELERRGLVA